ncbi:Glycosyltransferase involved in cell wall bisynthesis [Marinitoga hydrogenitolerans DSM 16785]|uniref:Glycosyltransferase involved in cell wall bisynthesis n=1 Tax=Marinitoga hydrogenitolerans (strain DSM 16785 / JCM 12826 / AT1271) TaxID=1122195 RepID=A0A1M4YX90_MARH1|nr:glycosyltransferase [Marinitoga hydrogenitolerans]SHF10328.1 Glycosyltransferase involved in cell wall bisynthesis [Marinitoga hydrogenitolerans DSM 16785]
MEYEYFINLVPIKSGGGLQNAINFIIGFNEIEKNKNKYIFLVSHDYLEHLCKIYNLNYKRISNRLFFETLYFLNKKNKKIFTLFGGKPLFSYGNKNIVGFAYSNLLYPEIDFWGYLPRSKRIIKKLKDIYRFLMIINANEIIFETDLLFEKAKKNRWFKNKRLYVVKMAANALVKEVRSKKNPYCEKLANSNEKFKILYLASSHPNKRQLKLVEIAKELKKMNNKKILFITTMQKNKYYKDFINKIKKECVEEYFFNFGIIPNKDVPYIISCSDALINIAVLESFSNNFVEAWQMKKPLFVTNADWAVHNCKDAAIYLDVENIMETTKKLMNSINNTVFLEKIVANGEKRLKTFSNYKEKVFNYLNIIKGNL